MAGTKLFERAENLQPSRSVFDLSHNVLLTCDMGQLIPVMCEEMVPGDKFQLGSELVVRFAPMVAPILHEVNVYVHVYFVPYRILSDEWEEFITGGVDGESSVTLPTWDPTSVAVGSLWDYLGFPATVKPPAACLPVAWPLYAYNAIYNVFYRDETQIEEVDLTDETIKLRAWEKDYFTSALPFQQRGIAPALPISGTTNAEFPLSQFVNAIPTTNLGFDSSGHFASNVSQAASKAVFDVNTVDLSNATTFDVADIRLAFRIQEWLERNARAGARYTEFLKAHFGVSPRDDRLQRPEYVGGSRAPVIVSEVLQTSATGTTPQGNMAGHGLTADLSSLGSYYAQEYGCIMAIMSVLPRPVYQQGLDRQWSRKTRYDYYSPEFANLSEQAILRQEVFCTTVEADNLAVWAFQGRWDEMRVKHSRVAGLMRTTLDYWHLSRQFASAPQLNQAFIECVPRKDIFAAPSEPGLIVNLRNVVRAVRPLPFASNPSVNSL